MNRSFDHTAADFTLEKIIEFGFDQYAEQINEISGAATKELAIEQVTLVVFFFKAVIRYPPQFFSYPFFFFFRVL